MAQSMKENATRANARTAGVAALIVGVVMIVQSILQAAIGVVSTLGYGLGAGGSSVGDLRTTFAPVVAGMQSFGTSVLPIAIGVFLAFWLVAPLAADMRVTRVVLRSLVASGVASAVSLAITVVASLGGAFASSGPFFGAAFPAADGSIFYFSFIGGVQSVFSTFVGVTPLVILAGFLAWFWSSKGRPKASEI